MTAPHTTVGPVPHCPDPVWATGAAHGPLAMWSVLGWLTVCVAMCCAGGAGWLLSAGNRTTRRARRLLAAEAVAARPGRSWVFPGSAGREHRWSALRGYRGSDAAYERAGCSRPWTDSLVRLAVRRETWCLAAGVVVAVLGGSVLPVLFGFAVLPVVRRAVRTDRARRQREHRADAVITLCGALAGEVRAGRHPGEALLAVVGDAHGTAAARATVLAAARFGGDVPAALAGAAREPGAEGLLGLAACWRVAVDSGAGLATGLERLEDALRAERAQRADLRAQLAGARATALLLAWLPVLGLLLGTALGAHPLHVLLHSGAGLGCLVVGGVLEGVGLGWALRIVRKGEDG